MNPLFEGARGDLWRELERAGNPRRRAKVITSVLPFAQAAEAWGEFVWGVVRRPQALGQLHGHTPSCHLESLREEVRQAPVAAFTALLSDASSDGVVRRHWPEPFSWFGRSGSGPYLLPRARQTWALAVSWRCP